MLLVETGFRNSLSEATLILKNAKRHGIEGLDLTENRQTLGSLTGFEMTVCRGASFPGRCLLFALLATLA